MDICQNHPLPDWTSGFEHRRALASQLPYEEYTGPMEQPAYDSNKYRLIRLLNNLVVMCVQDVGAKASAAALSVNVGSSMDPMELQGLAHLLEHMLPRGTEKFPGVDEYHSYISRHDGNCNASTNFSRTRFYFGIPSNAFEGALDRFSSFLTSPVFSRDCIDRELCAVDTEFKGLLNSDTWRLQHLESKLSEQSHPRSKFTPGNMDTLQQSAKDHGLDLQEELIKFYNKYYSPDIMKLVVCGNHALDQLVEWSVSKFSAIKSKGDSVQRDLGHPVSAEFLGKVVHYETLDDKDVMIMRFPIPSVSAMYRSYPFYYINHFIGHKEQGSITAHLKRQGWATAMLVSTNFGKEDGFCEFSITIKVTQKGLNHYEDIMRVVFAYVRMLVDSGPQEWVHHEISSQLQSRFDSKKKSKAVSQALSYMYLIFNKYVAPEHILSKGSLCDRFDYNAIQHFLGFINPGNFRVFIGATKHLSVDCSEVEPYFGTAYHVLSLPADLLRDLASNDVSVDGLYLPVKPEPTQAIAATKSSNILDNDALAFKHTLLKLNDNFELWLRCDGWSRKADGRITLSINVPAISSSPQNHVMSLMYCDMLKNKLSNDLDSAEHAGLKFGVDAAESTIEIHVEGSSNKLIGLLIAIVEEAKAFKVADAQFLACKDHHASILADMDNRAPIELCRMNMACITKSNQWHYKLVASELAKLTSDGMQAHVDSLFDVTFFKMCVMGKYNEEDALDVADSVQYVLNSSPALEYRAAKPRCFDIKPGYYLYQMQMPNSDCVTSAAECTIYCGWQMDDTETAMSLILQEYVRANLIALLCAKHQLGFKARVSLLTNLGNRYALCLQIEGKSNPMFMTMYVNRLLHEMQQQLVDMTEEEFEDRIESFTSVLEEQNTGARGGKHKEQVRSVASALDVSKQQIDIVQSVTKRQLVEFWNKHFLPSAALEYTRIDVQMWSAKTWKPAESEFENYSAKTLALFGCLHNEGFDALDIGRVDEFITVSIAAHKELSENSKDAESLIAELKSTSMSASGAKCTGGEGAKHAIYTGIALELAIKDHKTFGNYAHIGCTDFTTAGMAKTPDGIWLVTDHQRFQAMQRLCSLEASDVAGAQVY
ncbi:metalloprotease [Coemansia sp. RSA 2050]|nr:metalloprotease [Coemansia sp. RSA 2050]